jgi:hypothetical protein
MVYFPMLSDGIFAQNALELGTYHATLDRPFTFLPALAHRFPDRTPTHNDAPIIEWNNNLSVAAIHSPSAPSLRL